MCVLVTVDSILCLNYAPSSGSGVCRRAAGGSGCSRCPGAAEPLSCPAVSTRPGAQRVVSRLRAADFQTTNEHARVSTPHRLTESARTVACHVRGGGTVEALSLPELLPSAGREGGGERGGGGAGQGAKAGEAGTGGADVYPVRGLL